MRTRKKDAHSAATRTNRGLRFFPFMTRRPLFALCAVLSAAIGITVLLFPGTLPDYEPFREVSIQLTGKVCGLEQKLEGDKPVWRLMLSDVKIESLDSDGIPEAGVEAASPDSDGTSKAGTIAEDQENEAGAKVENKYSAGATEFPIPEKRERVLCVLDNEPRVEISSRVRVRGKLFPFRGAMNEGEFDLRRYYHILRIEFSIRNTKIVAVSPPADRFSAALYHLKKYISIVIDRLFSTQNSAVLKAMLLGEKGMLEDETKELYQGAGIIHILSISGLHLSLIGMGLFSLTGKIRIIPLPVRAAISVLAVFLYGKMIGMGTSAFRALIMLTLYIISKVIGRTYDILTASGLAAILLLLDQPLYILHTGFQFSFGAVLAIGILLPALPGRALKTLAIPIVTLPIYMWSFGTFPICSILLNLIVIPLMTAVMISAGGAVLLYGMIGFAARALGGPMTRSLSDIMTGRMSGIMSSRLSGCMSGIKNARMPDSLSGYTKPPAFLTLAARLIALPAELILDFYRFLAEASEKIPGHEIILGRPAVLQILLYYLMLCCLTAISIRLQMPHMRRHIEAAAFASQETLHRENDFWQNTLPDRILQLIAVKICRVLHLYDNHKRKQFGCIVCALWLGTAVMILTFHRPPAFEIDMLYVGQGDGIFISCEGRYFLIDGGSTSKKNLAKYTLLPFLHCKGVDHLDGIILTHDDGDHCSGLLELLGADTEGLTSFSSEESVSGSISEKSDNSSEEATISNPEISPGISISAIYLPEIAEKAKGDKYRMIENLSSRANIPVCYISRGQRIRTGPLTIDCLHPAYGASYEDANEYSTTLLLRYTDSSGKVSSAAARQQNTLTQQTASQQQNLFAIQETFETDAAFSALLTGDLEGKGEEDLLQFLDSTGLLESAAQTNDNPSTPQQETAEPVANPDYSTQQQETAGIATNPDYYTQQQETTKSEANTVSGQTLSRKLHINVLKVAHHGSKNATSENFLKMISPDVAIISAGIDNMYGHPSDALLERLRTASPQPAVFRTDLQGEITIWQKKGGEYQVKTFLGDEAETSGYRKE